MKLQYWQFHYLSKQARGEIRVRRASYVRNIKNAIINVFGSSSIGNFPGNKATQEEVYMWKTSRGVSDAKQNLWKKVENDSDDGDTYMNRITNEVLKGDDRTAENCAFIVAVVNLMLDSNIRTTVLTSELLERKLKEFSEKSNDENVDDSHDDEE